MCVCALAHSHTHASVFNPKLKSGGADQRKKMNELHEMNELFSLSLSLSLIGSDRISPPLQTRKNRVKTKSRVKAEEEEVHKMKKTPFYITEP